MQDVVRPMRKGDLQMAYLRKPLGHVYSQFLEFKYDPWGKKKIRGHETYFKNVTTWLKYFKGGTVKDDFGCYHPYNMQTRAFTCKGNLKKQGAHHYSSESSVE